MSIGGLIREGNELSGPVDFLGEGATEDTEPENTGADETAGESGESGSGADETAGEEPEAATEPTADEGATAPESKEPTETK